MLTIQRDNTTEGLVIVTDGVQKKLYNSTAKVRGIFPNNNSFELRIDEDVFEVTDFSNLTINGTSMDGLTPAQISGYLSPVFYKGSTGGGGGATPNLQAVTDVGNITTNEIISYNNAGDGNTGAVSVSGASGADNRGVRSYSNETEDGGVIQFTNKSGDSGYIKCNELAGGSSIQYELPFTDSGLAETFALRSDLPNLQISTPGYIPVNNVNAMNINDTTQITLNTFVGGYYPFSMGVNFAYMIISGTIESNGAGDCIFVIDMPPSAPINILPLNDIIGQGVAYYNSEVIPVAALNQGGTSGRFYFAATSAAVYKIRFIASYPYNA